MGHKIFMSKMSFSPIFLVNFSTNESTPKKAYPSVILVDRNHCLYSPCFTFVVDDDDVTNESTRQSTRHILCL